MKSALLSGTAVAGIIAAFASAVPTPLLAQSSASTEKSSVETVMVTAEKRVENIQDTPVPVTVVTADTLMATNQVDLRAFAVTIPGLTAQGDILSGTNLSIRGIAGGGAPTVGITIDGVPFTGSTISTGGSFLADIDPSDLERVEVLRGPQGTLYGANSMGGLIQYVTRDPSTDAFSGRLEAGLSGVYNGVEPGFVLRGSANIPLTDTIALRVSAFDRQDPGYIDNVLTGQNGVNKTTSTGGRASLLWRPSDDFSWKLGMLYEYIKADAAPDSDIGLGDLQQNYIPNSSGDTRMVAAFSSEAKWQIGGINLVSLTGYSEVHSHFGLDFSFVFGPLVQNLYGVSGAAYNGFAPVDKFTQEFRASGQFWEHFDWLVGGYYAYEHYNPTGIQTVEAEDPATGKIVSNGFFLDQTPNNYLEYAAFVDLTYHLTDQFDVEIGGRQTFSKFDFGEIDYGPGLGQPLFPALSPTSIKPTDVGHSNVFTYLLTPKYKVTPDLMIYARLASGFRPGSPNGLAPGVPQQSSADKTQNYEVGVKGDLFDNLLTFDGSLYYINWNALQVSSTSGGFNFIANGGSAKSEGVELNLSAHPMDGLTVAGWIAYDNAVLTEAFPKIATVLGAAGDRLPLDPTLSANASINQEFPLWGDFTGFAGGQLSFIGDRLGLFENGPRTFFPSYTKLDLHAGVTEGPWTVNAYINNITDVRGQIGGGGGYLPPNALIFITPRTFGINVVRNFE